MTELRRFVRYHAVFKPVKRDDLKPEWRQIVGNLIMVEPLWEIEEGPYEGDWACQVYGGPIGWCPSRDLSDITEAP